MKGEYNLGFEYAKGGVSTDVTKILKFKYENGISEEEFSDLFAKFLLDNNINFDDYTFEKGWENEDHLNNFITIRAMPKITI